MKDSLQKYNILCIKYNKCHFSSVQTKVLIITYFSPGELGEKIVGELKLGTIFEDCSLINILKPLYPCQHCPKLEIHMC